MPAPTVDRIKARDAFSLASDLMMDLMGGMQVHRTFQKWFALNPPSEQLIVQVNRVCLFHLILTLAKWREFYDRYLDVIPLDVREQAKALSKAVVDRGIPDFRNKVVGHIWDADAKRPLIPGEVERRLDTLMAPGLHQFMLWVNNPDNNAYPSTAISVVERVRDRLRDVHGFTDADLLA